MNTISDTQLSTVRMPARPAVTTDSPELQAQAPAMAPEAQKPPREPSKAETQMTEQQAMTAWQEALSAKRNLQFSVDETSGQRIVKVVDVDSGDVIRQMPSEEALRLAKALKDYGSILEEKA